MTIPLSLCLTAVGHIIVAVALLIPGDQWPLAFVGAAFVVGGLIVAVRSR